MLQSGSTLWQARLAYKTYGALNAAEDNVVLIPTFYAGHHTDVEVMMAPGRAIDPQKHFVVVVNMFGNGLSSSPSNTPPPLDRAAFPRVSVYDNVVAQHRLVTEALGMPNAELRPIPSIWGHAAGRGGNPVDNTFIDTALRDLLR